MSQSSTKNANNGHRLVKTAPTEALLAEQLLSRKLREIKVAIYMVLTCAALILIGGCAPDPGPGAPDTSLAHNADVLLTEEIKSAWWYLEPDSELLADERLVIRITREGMGGLGYCNGFGMFATIDAQGNVTPERFSQQSMGCATAAEEADARFFRQFFTVTHLAIDGDDLILTTPDGELGFRRYVDYMSDWRLNPAMRPTPTVQPTLQPAPEAPTLVVPLVTVTPYP